MRDLEQIPGHGHTKMQQVCGENKAAFKRKEIINTHTFLWIFLFKDVKLYFWTADIIYFQFIRHMARKKS